MILPYVVFCSTCKDMVDKELYVYILLLSKKKKNALPFDLLPTAAKSQKENNTISKSVIQDEHDSQRICKLICAC